MKSSIYILLCCVSLIPRWISSQEADCLTGKAHKGKCISIMNCPALLEIAKSPLISKSERKYLDTHKCGEQKVCCEMPLIIADATTPTTTTTTTTAASINIPNESVCGFDSEGYRIFGGNITAKEQFRWTVALDYKLPNKNGVRCGGSLINTRYVLTAAHCVETVREHDLILRLGEWDTESVRDCDEYEDCNPPVRAVEVNRIIIHPDYGNKVHDIALLKMEHALPENYTTHILPICLPLKPELMHDYFYNKNVSVVGWGRHEKGATSRLKMYAELTTISNQRCKDELENQLNEKQICAKSLTGGYRDACQGDSGGPLQIQINGTYYLIGIVSHGPRCGQTTLPAVYTRVTSYVDWILKNITD